MALNEIYKHADELVFPVHTSVDSGDVVQVGEVVGVAQEDAVTGEDGNTYSTLKLNGAFEVAILADETFTVGQKAYGLADATSGVIAVVQESPTDAKLVGHVIKVTTGFVIVRLAQN
jgi:predicted RecA/RadA family phage recombinase